MARAATRVSPGAWTAAYERYRWFHYQRAGVAFCHIPKNAGSTIAIEAYGRRLGHIPMSQILAEMPNEKRVPIVAILRDPVERFLSAYRYATSGGGSDGIIDGADRFTSVATVDSLLDEFVDIPEPERDPVFRSQSFYLDADPKELEQGSLILIEQSNLEILGTIPILARLGITGATHRNRSQGSEASLTPAEQARVESIYAFDRSLAERFSEFLVQPV